MAAKRFWELGTLGCVSLLLGAPVPPSCGPGSAGAGGASGTAGTGALPGVCGNGEAEGWLETWENCDGTDLRGTTCSELHGGYVGGTLRCAADCQFDTSDCISAVCGDGKVDGLESCDGPNLGGFRTCTEAFQNAVGGVLTCGADCQYDTSSCRFPVCGDGLIEGYEECEGSDLGQYAGQNCADFPVGMLPIFGFPVNYLPANLGCRECRLDKSACVPPPGCYLGFGAKLPPIICF